MKGSWCPVCLGSVPGTLYNKCKICAKICAQKSVQKSAQNISAKSAHQSKVSKGGFLWGGEISIIGVARATAAIINFASTPCENLWVCIGFNKELPHKKRKINYCKRCVHPPQLLRFASLTKTPLWKPPNQNRCKNRTRNRCEDAASLEDEWKLEKTPRNSAPTFAQNPRSKRKMLKEMSLQAKFAFLLMQRHAVMRGSSFEF